MGKSSNTKALMLTILFYVCFMAPWSFFILYSLYDMLIKKNSTNDWIIIAMNWHLFLCIFVGVVCGGFVMAIMIFKDLKKHKEP